MPGKRINRVLKKLSKYEDTPQRSPFDSAQGKPAIIRGEKNDHLFETKYGYFQDGGREFVIKTPHTPGLWANFLTNGKYTALISPTGSGYSWYEESGYNRILREHPLRHLIEDLPGRYIYIKDLQTNDYWSSSYQPVGKANKFKATHSLGFTKSQVDYKDIESEVTYFIPFDKSYEVWHLKLKNNSTRTRKLKLYTYCEFVLGSYRPDLLENSFNSMFFKGEKIDNALIFTKPILTTKDNLILRTYDKIGFFTTNEKFNEYEVSRRDFIGFGKSLGQPQVLTKKSKLSSSPKQGENMIGCISVEITLKPGAEKEVYFALGLVNNPEEIVKVHTSLTRTNMVRELDKIKKYWDKQINKIWIETPDEGLNIWFNYWLKYQIHFNAHWSEMDSFYIGGGGGFGFRDTAQHIWGILPFDRDLYLKHLRFLLSHQSPNGSVPHGISIFSNEASNSPHSDDPCWLVFAVLNYLEETNDLKFLDEDIAFHDGLTFGKEHKGSVLRHIIRAADHSLRHMSERGIPQMQVADWNDALSSGIFGKGESFLTAGLLAANLQRLVELLKKVKRQDKVNEYTYAYKRLSQSIINFGWDGDWFLRATQDHQKKPIGSKSNERGQIFLDSNSWLCISGLSGSYTEKTLNSMWERLMTKYGALIFSPAYSTEDKQHGVISQFVPGSKENASIFLHANAWFFIALCQALESEKAHKLLKSCNPIHASYNFSDTYKVEPYVLSEFIFGKESDKFGEGSFSWVTGSAEWFFRGILEFFLGLKSTYGKVTFEPKVPKDWTFKVEREFNGKRWIGEYEKGVSKLKSVI